MDIFVRICVASEVEAIASREPVGKNFATDMFAAQEIGVCRFLVAWAGEEPVGSAELTTEDVPELKNLNVRQEFRGHGIGTQIIAAAEELIGKPGALSIGVAADNRRAGELYERLGYHRTGQFSTTTYDYIDDKGAALTATETDEMLTKRW